MVGFSNNACDNATTFQEGNNLTTPQERKG